jgi:quercetin dioxygenase-like cupin family protein
MIRVAQRIRSERKRLGLTLEELAEKVGISASVTLLSDIAYHLNKSIVSFVEDGEKPTVLMKAKDQQSISTPSLMLKTIGPKNMITNKIIINYGEMKKGHMIDAHSHIAGIEWVYLIAGKSEHIQNGHSIIIEAGDSLSYDARGVHSVRALEDNRFFGIYVKD